MIKKMAPVICIIFILLYSGSVKAQDQNLEKAKELWEKVIVAKGGRENLYAIKNLVVSNKSYNPSENEEFQNSKSVELFVVSGKWWSWTDDRPGFTLNISQYDFEREIGYEITENSKEVSIYKPKESQKLSNEKLSILLDGTRYNNFAKEQFLLYQLIYLMETKRFQPEIKRISRERVNGEKLDVIEASFGRQKLEYFIDSITHLPKKVRISVWFDRKKAFSVFETFFLEDYVEVANIKFPQVVRLSKKSETKTTYQVNVKYNENLFNTPPSIEAGIDAWKALP